MIEGTVITKSSNMFGLIKSRKYIIQMKNEPDVVMIEIPDKYVKNIEKGSEVQIRFEKIGGD